MDGDFWPLTGFTVGVTAERKAGELASLLERRGARVIRAPAMHTVPLPEDGELFTATENVLAAPVDVVVAMTGMGFRGWIESAEYNGVRSRLVSHLAAARSRVARGAKARGAVRGAGLTETWTSPSEQSGEILDYLLHRGVEDKRIVIQVHGDPMAEFRAALREAGAEVLAVPVYRWTDPADLDPVDRLVNAVIAGSVDALPFTSAPAAANLLDRAERLGRGEQFREALRTKVFVACVGPVTASPLASAGVPYQQPERARTASLVRLIVDELPRWAPNRY